jgi:hypothetical protein
MRVLASSDLISILPRRVAQELVADRSLAIRQLAHSSPNIATAMIWPRWLDNQPARRWPRQNVEFTAHDLRSN